MFLEHDLLGEGLGGRGEAVAALARQGGGDRRSSTGCLRVWGSDGSPGGNGDRGVPGVAGGGGGEGGGGVASAGGGG